MADDLYSKILADYPDLAFLFNDPEVGKLLLDAVNPDQGFDAPTFQSKLRQTNWWRTHSASQRQWETLAATDPAQSAAARRAKLADVFAQAGSLGITLDWSAADNIAFQAQRDGLDANQVNDLIANAPRSTATTAGSLKSIAAGDYMVPISDYDSDWWARKIASGQQTEQTFRAFLTTQAIGRFPQLKDAINSGITPGQYFSSYKQLIGQQLEVPAESVDLLNDPKWQQVISYNDNGKIRPMTLAETTKLARGQDAYKRTQGGQQLGAQVGEFITKTFGKVS